MESTQKCDKLNHLLEIYFEKLYKPLKKDIQDSYLSKGNEIYGELCFHSLTKLLKHLELKETDHFFDLGSGLGKLVFQLFLSTSIVKITGIEINVNRMKIAKKIETTLKHTFPELFQQKVLNLVEEDFLSYAIGDITILYTCSTIFSYSFLCDIGRKVNDIPTLQKVVSLRKIPTLSNFELDKILTLEASWDTTTAFIYIRKRNNVH